MDQQGVAAELYALETQRPLTGAQMERWCELAAVLFGRTGPHEQRSSPRLTGSAQVLVGVEAFDIVDVNWTGLRIEGPGTAGLSVGSPVKITGIRTNASEAWQHVALSCSVTAERGQGSHRVLVLTEENARERHDYFMRAYYPVYLSYLRALAS